MKCSLLVACLAGLALAAEDGVAPAVVPEVLPEAQPLDNSPVAPAAIPDDSPVDIVPAVPDSAAPVDPTLPEQPAAPESNPEVQPESNPEALPLVPGSPGAQGQPMPPAAGEGDGEDQAESAIQALREQLRMCREEKDGLREAFNQAHEAAKMSNGENEEEARQAKMAAREALHNQNSICQGIKQQLKALRQERHGQRQGRLVHRASKAVNRLQREMQHMPDPEEQTDAEKELYASIEEMAGRLSEALDAVAAATSEDEKKAAVQALKALKPECREVMREARKHRQLSHLHQICEMAEAQNNQELLAACDMDRQALANAEGDAVRPAVKAARELWQQTKQAVRAYQFQLQQAEIIAVDGPAVVA